MKYRVDVFTYPQLKDKIISPRIQRGLVWKESKKKGLIETIKKGLPIGSILVTEKKDKYKIVDGLQRYSTIVDFEKDRFSYIDKNEITNDDIEKLLKLTKEYKTTFLNFTENAKNEHIEKIRNIMVAAFKSSGKLSEGILVNEICNTLINDISFIDNNDRNNLFIGISDIYHKIDEYLRLENIKIPTIIFNGTDSEMVETFMKLNSEGVKLSKYDIFAASWRNVTIKLENEQMIEKIINKYNDTFEKSGIEIDDFDEDLMRKTKEVTLFEYSYSLGKIISENSKFLYKGKGVSDVDSIGFSILASILNISNKEMKKLGDANQLTTLDFDDLTEKILKILEELEDVLESWLKSPGRLYITPHSELQLVSYIVSLFKIKYVILSDGVIKNNENIKQLTKDFKRYLHKHYLYDVLRGYWAGSGDSKLDDIVIDFEPSNNRYIKDIDTDSFRNVILTWIDEENSKVKKPISAEVKTFCNYLFNGKSSLVEVNNKKFDYDHIIPKKRLMDKFKENYIYPISTPCNIVIIPDYENRAKREDTIYEYNKKKQSMSLVDLEKLNDYNYPTKEELKFVESFETFTIDNYIKFTEDRKNFLINKIMEILYY